MRYGMRPVVLSAALLAAATVALTAPPSAPVAAPALPSVSLPPELARVLRDYERAWQARDASALSTLFAEDGFVLSSGKPPVRGRDNIRASYSESGGPLALRRGSDGRWLIAADMDNSNRSSRPPPSPSAAPPTPPPPSR